MRKPGLLEVEKTRPLFVLYFYILLFYALFYPLDFVFSFLLPGWKFMITQVDQIS